MSSFVNFVEGVLTKLFQMIKNVLTLGLCLPWSGERKEVLGKRESLGGEPYKQFRVVSFQAIEHGT